MTWTARLQMANRQSNLKLYIYLHKIFMAIFTDSSSNHGKKTKNFFESAFLWNLLTDTYSVHLHNLVSNWLAPLLF